MTIMANQIVSTLGTNSGCNKVAEEENIVLSEIIALEQPEKSNISELFENITDIISSFKSQINTLFHELKLLEKCCIEHFQEHSPISFQSTILRWLVHVSATDYIFLCAFQTFRCIIITGITERIM